MYIIYYSNHSLFKVSGYLSFAKVQNTEDRLEKGMLPRAEGIYPLTADDF